MMGDAMMIVGSGDDERDEADEHEHDEYAKECENG